MTSWVLIGNKWFYFNASGVMQTGWIQLEGKWYYLDLAGELMTGWVWADGNRYYCDESGVMQTGWLYNRGEMVLSEAVRRSGDFMGTHKWKILLVLVNKYVGLISLQYYQTIIAYIIDTMPIATVSNIAQ